ncbi:MAG: hypothetical protein C0490_27685 [Marivirga sp.]|nr:hypothetical protein [Marivirga sp.]
MAIHITVQAQDFVGKVIYSNSYKSKIPNVPDEQLNAMMGTTQEFFIRNGDYKSTLNGSFLQWQLYINKDNKLYTKMSNSASVLWNDGAANADQVLKTELKENAIDILGHKCHELILTCKSGVQKYYYSTDFKIDPKLYENHKFGNWSEFISKSKSLPLRIIIDSPQFVLESTATEIKPMELMASMFELPTDSKLEKSPF